jgi:hypothetical protein
MSKTQSNIQKSKSTGNGFEQVCKRYDWLVEARYANQSLTKELYKYKNHQKDKDQWKIYSVLVGCAFSLWRAAPLNNISKNPEQFREDAYELLNILVRDNAVTYNQDKRLEEWMAGYYLRNCYLRLKQIKNTIDELGITDIDILDYSRFKKLISKNPQDCWMELQILSTAVFEKLADALKK